MQTATATATTYAEFVSDYLGIDMSEAQKLTEELCDYGIYSQDIFEETYQGTYDSWKAEEEFAQEFYDGLGEISTDNPLYSFIDWQQVWNCHLRYDYSFIGDIYVFRTSF